MNPKSYSHVKIDCAGLEDYEKEKVYNFFRSKLDGRADPMPDDMPWHVMGVIYPHSQGFSIVGWDNHIHTNDAYTTVLTKEDLGDIL